MESNASRSLAIRWKRIGGESLWFRLPCSPPLPLRLMVRHDTLNVVTEVRSLEGHPVAIEYWLISVYRDKSTREDDLFNCYALGN
jgi:hypothetical protein